MIMADIWVAMESEPVVVTISVNSAVEALPERGFMTAMDKASIGISRKANTL